MPARQPSALGPVSNDGALTITSTTPYTVQVTIEGDCDLLFHRWSVEAVATKAAAAKGSEAKKTDDVESYLWRDDDGFICVPGEYLRMAMVEVGRSHRDPRSARKSALDLYKAAFVSLTPLAPILVGDRHRRTKDWDYLDQRRVTIQRNGITRTRPAFRAGWQATVVLMVNLPDYVPEGRLREIVGQSGRTIGIADFRPTYGRFSIIYWKHL